jgi:hypothetical protein
MGAHTRFVVPDVTHAVIVAPTTPRNGATNKISAFDDRRSARVPRRAVIRPTPNSEEEA